MIVVGRTPWKMEGWGKGIKETKKGNSQEPTNQLRGSTIRRTVQRLIGRLESWRRGETQQVKEKERGRWGVGQKEKRKRRKMEDDEWLEPGAHAAYTSQNCRTGFRLGTYLRGRERERKWK